MSRERGLVISVPIRQVGRKTTFNGYFDLQELRFSLLFWDKLDLPSNNLGLEPRSVEVQFLQNAGILNRTHIKTSGRDLVAAYLGAHVAAFKELDKKEPGVWSLATGENAISFSDSGDAVSLHRASFPELELEAGRGVLVSLHRAIPVPDKDVPLEDILSFRTKRRDELIALRLHLEDIYQRVISAGDGELALTTERDRLEKSINDYLKASRETSFKFSLFDIDASLNLITLLPQVAVGYALGLPPLDALLKGATGALKLGVGPSLKVSAGPSLKGRDAISTPFKYVLSYHQEVFF
jgi:Family of unknown function (DUF6236)